MRTQIKRTSRLGLNVILAAGLFAVSIITGIGVGPAAATNSFLVSAARPSEPVGARGENFFTKEVSVTTADGNVTVAGSSDGTSSFWVDDIMEMDITHADGTTSTYQADDSNNCTASTVLDTPPTSLAPYLKAGLNTVRIIFRDACGGNDGNSDIYLVGNAGFSNGAPKTVTTSAYTVVRYLQQISTPACIANLLSAKIVAAPALCGFLANSTNTFPPSTLSGKSLTDFIAGKEYRQYVHYPAYDVTCAGGVVQGISASAGSVPFSWGLGYTRLKGPHGTNYFSLAEPYLQDNNYDRVSPDEIYSSDRSSVAIIFQDASRLASAERYTNYALTHLDAPFIWTDLIEKVSCDGIYGITVSTSNVPTTDIYINGHEVSYDKQSSDLAAFLKEGGGILNPAGYGNLAYPCHVKYFDATGHLAQSFTGCVSGTGFSGLGGGSSGGGGASGSW